MREKAPKVRIDQLLVDRALAPTKARAQAIVLGGSVWVEDQRIDKAGALVRADAAVEIRGESQRYVSRGGTKLEGALAAFTFDVTGLTCLDVGASTGGFTDCLLQHGARAVVAVDVGYGQLAHKLRVDPRVKVLERTNARDLTPEAIGGAVDLTVVDASFIGLGKLLAAVARCTRPGGALIALVKPQFEVGREEASRGKGVIRDVQVRAGAIAEAALEVRAHGFTVLGQADCVIEGPKGNLEAFVYARRNP